MKVKVIKEFNDSTDNNARRSIGDIITVDSVRGEMLVGMGYAEKYGDNDGSSRGSKAGKGGFGSE
jgi:hypothetical protein